MSRFCGKKYSLTLRVFLALECYETARGLYGFDKNNNMDLSETFYSSLKENKQLGAETSSVILYQGQRAWEFIKARQNEHKRILIIEDEAVFRDTLLDVLLKQGYIIDTAGSGYEAISKAEEKSFDLILSDVRIPGKDGIETTDIIRSKSKFKPVVIIVTGFSDENAVIRAIKTGVNDYMRKPFDIDDLLTNIKKYLHKADQRDEKKEDIDQHR